MATNKLTLGLKGAAEAEGEVTLDEFRDFCGDVLACLKKVEGKFPGLPKLKYQIVELRHGSATACVRAVHNNKEYRGGAKVLRLFATTTASIQSGGQIPSEFSSDDLLPFQRLAAPLRKGSQAIKVGRTILTNQYIRNLEEYLGDSRSAQGSCRGIIERLNGHQKYEFTLFPVVGNRIICRYPKEMEKDVLDSYRKNVTVYGKIAYLPGQFFPDRADVVELIPHPSDSELPRLSDLKGKLKGLLEGKTAAEYIRAIRDE